MQIFIRDTYWKTHVFDCKPQTTLHELKTFIYKQTGLPRTWQRFVYGGKNVYSGKYTLQELKIDSEASLQLLLKWHGVGCTCGGKKCSNMLLRNGKRIGVNY